MVVLNVMCHGESSAREARAKILVYIYIHKLSLVYIGVYIYIYMCIEPLWNHAGIAVGSQQTVASDILVNRKATED